jgi:hypothetical protein
MKKLFGSIVAFAVPMLSFAAPYSDLDDIIKDVLQYGNKFIALLISFAVIYIIYAVVVYIISGDDEGKLAAAKNKILWGVIGLVVILSIWGIVGVVRNTFNFGPNQAPTTDFPKVIEFKR